MPPRPSSADEIEEHLSTLQSTVERIARATDGVSETILSTSPGGKAWSAYEILLHLRACADLWSFSIFAMLSEKDPELGLLDERRWAQATRARTPGFGDAFEAFARLRRELLRALQAAPPTAWNRTARIGGRAHSVYSQTRRMALHEAEHCRQIESLPGLNSPS
jgi:hypothetical protein